MEEIKANNRELKLQINKITKKNMELNSKVEQVQTDNNK